MHRILVQILPAHSSHLTQLLDVKLFSSLQHNYSKLVINQSRETEYLALYKSNFWPLLHKAREQTYTLANIKGAQHGTELVPYNKVKILSCLGSPFTTASENLNGDIQTPKNARQFRFFMAQTEQLIEKEGVEELLVKTIRTLAKLSLQE